MIFEASVAGRTVKVEVRGGEGRYTLQIDGQPLEVSVADAGARYRSLLVGGVSHELGLERAAHGYRVVFAHGSLSVELADVTRAAAAPARADGPARLTAPMPGRVVRVLLAPGADVTAGQGLLVIEAMKMENELRAPRGGRLTQLLVSEGQAVEAGALLAVVG